MATKQHDTGEMHGRTVIIWNPSAGSAAGATALKERLQSLDKVVIREPESWSATVEQAATAAKQGAAVIVAAGGDGTLNAVVTGIMQNAERPVIGVLPLGSGNDFARTLKLPLDPEQAWHTILRGKSRAIDITQVQTAGYSGWQVNMLTGGNSGRYLDEMTDEVKARWGPFCYLRGAFDLVGQLQTYDVKIQSADTTETFAAVNLFVANGRTSGGGLTVCAEADPGDGFLDLIVVRDGTTGDFASLVKDYVFSDFLQHPLIEHRRVQNLEIMSEPDLPLTVDGEMIGEANATTLSLHAQAFHVLS